MLPEKVPTSSWGAERAIIEGDCAERSEENPLSFPPSHNNSKQSVKVVDFWLSRRPATTHMHLTWPHHMTTTIELEQGRGGGSSITQLPDFERMLRGFANYTTSDTRPTSSHKLHIALKGMA